MPKDAVKEGRAKAQEVLDLYNQLFGTGGVYNEDAAEVWRKIVRSGGMEADILSPAGRTFDLEELEKLRGDLGTIFAPGAPWIDPEMRAVMDRYVRGQEAAEKTIGARGVTEESAALRKALGDIMAGRTPEMAGLSTFGRGVLEAKGMTPGLMEIQNAARQLMTNQGMTGALKEMERGGLDLIASGGMTPEMKDFVSKLQTTMQAGGMTPEAKQMFQEALKLVQAGGRGGALLPMENVLSFARDAAATAAAQRAEGIRRSANQRLGGAVGAGTAEQVMAEFADESARGEAEAIRGAAMGQQGLQLQQLLGALGAGGDLSKAAMALLSSYAGAGADVFRSAAANIGTGGEMVGTAAQQALGRMTQGMEGMGKTETQANLNQQRALEALGQYLDAQLGAGKSITDVFNLEAGRESNAFQALANLGSLWTGTYMGQQEMDLKRKMSEIGSRLESFGMSEQIRSGFWDTILKSAAGLSGIGSQYTGNLGAGMGAYGNISSDLIKAANTPGFWSTFFQNILQQSAGAALGGGAEMIGGDFGKGAGKVLAGGGG